MQTNYRFWARGVNLLKESSVETLEELQLKKIVYILTVVGSIFLVLISLLVLVSSLKIKEQADGLKEVEKKWTDKIESMSKVEGDNYVLSKKMESIKQIKDTIDFYKIFSTFDEVIPKSVSIIELSLDKEGAVSIDGEATDSLSLLSFFDGLINKDKDRLRSVVLNNLILTKESLYRFSLDIKYFKNR